MDYSFAVEKNGSVTLYLADDMIAGFASKTIFDRFVSNLKCTSLVDVTDYKKPVYHIGSLDQLINTTYK